MRTRSVCSIFRCSGAKLVRGLVARNGLLTPSTWDIFPYATFLRVLYDSDHLLDQSGIVTLASDLPSRLLGLRWQANFKQLVMCSRDPSYAEEARRWSDSFIKALLASACAGSLQRLFIEKTLDAAAACNLLQGLTNLQVVVIRLYSTRPPGQAKERAPRQLPKTLKHARIGLDSCNFDLTAIAACKVLENLQFHGDMYTLHNIASISSCTSLTAVSFRDLPSDFNLTALLAALQGLPSLESLHLDSSNISSSSTEWQQICRLQHLRELQLKQLTIESTAAPAGTITQLHLIISEGLSVQLQPPELGRGCLQRLLPALQQLKGPVVYPSDEDAHNMAVLDGHTSITKLTVNAMRAGTSHWCPLGSAAAQLQSLDLFALPASLARQCRMQRAACSCGSYASAWFPQRRCRA